MNKKRLTITILILMIAMMGFATTSSTRTSNPTLEIYAYKVGDIPTTEPSVVFELTDAISGSLDSITGTNRVIDVTNYRNELLATESTTSFERKLIFSYRLYGQKASTDSNAPTKYIISIKASPFYKDGAKDYTDETKIIDTYLTFENHLMQFYYGGKLINPDEESSLSLNYSYENGQKYEGKSSNDSGHEDITISETISVSSTTELTGDNYWLARAGIALSVSSDDFYRTENPVEKGLYVCDVTVTLTSGE